MMHKQQTDTEQAVEIKMKSSQKVNEESKCVRGEKV